MTDAPAPLPPVAHSIAALRSRLAGWRAAGETIAFVPTMGALHAGHLALVEAARTAAPRVVVSIFVNPMQFAPTEDFGSYPRTEAADLAMLAPLGVDAVFAPTREEMYPPGYATAISVGGPSQSLETDFRPHFFTGVATVVAKLLIAVMPDFALFGEKDFQQVQVVKRLVADLGLPMTILPQPIVREPDGLALSSRNVYLSQAERATAPELHRSLAACAAAIRGGELAMTALAEARARLTRAGFDVDYVELRDAETLAPVGDQQTEPMRLLAAARLGRTRLIDNVPV